MSLNWQATEIPEHLRNWTTRGPDGKEDTQMHPLMHRAIWLTMILGGSPSDLSLRELERRLAIIHRMDPDTLQVRFGGDLSGYRVLSDGDWLTMEEYCHRLQVPYVTYHKATAPRPVMFLTPSVIHRLYGTLWTNADRRPFAVWRKRYLDSVTRTLDGDYRRHLETVATLQAEQYAASQPEADPTSPATL